jgi:uncharacterized protein
VTAPTTSIPIIDADSHLTEPPTLWTDRLPRKYLDRAPHTQVDPASGITRWRLGDRWLSGVGAQSHAGWEHFPPSRPGKFEEINIACYDATERTKWMDEHGVAVQILYPNLVAFEGHAIMALKDAELQLAIIRAYNDYQTDFAAQAPGRFVPIAALPFWSMEASIAEMTRCAEAGHKGVLWAATLAKHDLPATTDPYWDPFYTVAQSLRMSINFHVGVGWTEDEVIAVSGRTQAFDLAAATGRTAQSWMSNAKMITDLIMDGVCERFPSLDFVSVESGFGWIPFLLEGLDWQWRNYDGPRLHGGLLPSEYFRRQIYSMFWFEESSLRLFDLYADNIMFETDFPHTTSLSPGPGSASVGARDIVARAREALDPVTFEKVMYGNAARVYHLGAS